MALCGKKIQESLASFSCCFQSIPAFKLGISACAQQTCKFTETSLMKESIN